MPTDPTTTTTTPATPAPTDVFRVPGEDAPSKPTEDDLPRWFVSAPGGLPENIRGPITDAELKRLASIGELVRTDLIWKDGMPEWHPASATKRLFPKVPTPPPLPPVPPPIPPPVATAPPRQRPLVVMETEVQEVKQAVAATAHRFAIPPSTLVMGGCLLVVIFGFLLYLARDHGGNPDPGPTPTVDGVSLGRSYARTLAPSLANGWDAAAKVVEDGGTVAAAMKAEQDTWLLARRDAMAQLVTPKFATVLPEGTDPGTPAKRAEVVALYRAFATGLRGGR